MATKRRFPTVPRECKDFFCQNGAWGFKDSHGKIAWLRDLSILEDLKRRKDCGNAAIAAILKKVRRIDGIMERLETGPDYSWREDLLESLREKTHEYLLDLDAWIAWKKGEYHGD